MEIKKTSGIAVFILAVVFSMYLISASSVLGFLFYDSTTGSSLTINDGDSFGLTVSADSIFENYMNVHVDLLESGGNVVATLLDTNVIQDSYSNHMVVDESVYGSAGDYTIKLTVTGDSGQTDTVELSLTVQALSPTNNLPTFTSSPVTSVNENTAYSYDVNANDADGDTLTYSLTQTPSWLSINSATGLISGTSPEVNSDTQFVVTVQVSDGNGNVAQVFTIDVLNVVIIPPTNNAPVITSGPVTSVNENTAYSYDVNANDADGDSLTYGLTQGPNWLSINSVSGLITGTSPSVSQNTNYAITVTVSDGTATVPQSYTLTVLNVVVPPVGDTTAPIITITSPTSITYSSSSINVIVSTNEQATAWFSLNGGSNVSLGTSNNQNFNYALTGLTNGNYNLVIYARDAAGNVGSSSVSFSVSVSSGSGNPIGGKSSKEASGGFKTLVFDSYGNLSAKNNFVPIDEAPVIPKKSSGSTWGLLLWILGILIFLILLFILIILLTRD